MYLKSFTMSRRSDDDVDHQEDKSLGSKIHGHTARRIDHQEDLSSLQDMRSHTIQGHTTRLPLNDMNVHLEHSISIARRIVTKSSVKNSTNPSSSGDELWTRLKAQLHKMTKSKSMQARQEVSGLRLSRPLCVHVLF